MEKQDELLLALYNLVKLKKHKDEKGKDEFYEIHKPNAWKYAKHILDKCMGECSDEKGVFPISCVRLSLPDISLMQAESIVLEKQSAIDVDCKIDHTEIGLLFMEGYYHAKRKLEGTN